MFRLNEMKENITINMLSTAEKCMEKVNYLIKTGDFSLVSNYLRPSNNSRHLIFNINYAVDNFFSFMKTVKYLPECEHFYCILEK